SRRVAIVFSPSVSTKIKDTEEIAPGTRMASLQSIFSRIRLSRMRLAISSSFAPRGPAKLTRPPRRATATAAFPAWPPDVIRNSDACTFVPASGNLSTRMMMSCTAPPAHRMRGYPRGSLKTDLVLYPGADDVMRDRYRRRGCQALRVFAHQ